MDSIIALIKPHVRKQVPDSRKGRKSWPKDAIRSRLIKACKDFVDRGLADPKFLTEITSGEKNKFWACMSEALVADLLNEKKFGQRKKFGAGPDFLVMDGDQRVWIEVVCPDPNGIPEAWLAMDYSRLPTRNAPPIEPMREEILLRWTNAIKTKADRLIGNPAKNKKGYLQTGDVDPEDAYVIAVNSCQLRNGDAPDISGISGHPCAVESVFSVGPRQLTFNLKTSKTIHRGHQFRPFAINKNNAMVPTDVFQDPRYSAVSAIWAMDLKGSDAIRTHEPIAIIHNPNASNPIRRGFLDADVEYEASEEDGSFICRPIVMKRPIRTKPLKKRRGKSLVSLTTKVPRKYRKRSQHWRF